MAKDERLNEEAARDPHTHPTMSTDEMVLLNQLTDRTKQLPRKSNKKSRKELENE